MNYDAKIVRVVDGDTVDADIFLGFDITMRQRLRLYGVNAPETRSRDPVEKARGLKAKEFLVDALKVCNNEVIINVHGSGKFGRPLVEIYISDVNLNDQLVFHGHAVAYFGGKR